MNKNNLLVAAILYFLSAIAFIVAGFLTDNRTADIGFWIVAVLMAVSGVLFIRKHKQKR